MHQQVAVIGQHPFSLSVSFQTNWQFTRLFLESLPHLVSDCLHLPLVRARADDERVGEGSNPREIENFDVDGFFRFRRSHGEQPGGGDDFNFGSVGRICLQNTLLRLWYNSAT